MDTITMSDLTVRLKMMLVRGDIAFALGVVAILVMLILPLPKVLLDVCLALSITFSVLILMTALFIITPLEFSSFPTILLVATMLRLALNVASTRLILSHGHEGTNAAGAVIQAFGNLVMEGNFVIGIIVFAILVIVNFIVITKGSGRIAEVSARFSLDAMPGKQMAIDADLSAGLIDENQAKVRRKSLEEESNFFGAMDGAAKFVRGDAIAGILITFINVVAGIIIGVAQKGLTLIEASATYTLLTVGDGLVSQIPALIVSTAAGMLVSKAGVEGSADKALISQLKAYPTALGLCSFLMACLALLPGIPMLPFLALSLITGGGAWKIAEKKDKEMQTSVLESSEQTEASLKSEETIAQALHIDYVRLELGYGLLSLLSAEAGKKLTDQIKALRYQLASDVGFILPAVRIQDNLQLSPTSYVIRIKEIEIAQGDLRPDMLLVMAPDGEPIGLEGEPTHEPTFGLPALWISSELKEEADQRGYTVVEPSAVITTHLTEIIKDNMSELLSFSETQKLIEGLDPAHQKLLTDIVPAQISTSGIQRILQNLLSERLSIRDLPTILEGIAESCGFTRSIMMIGEHVRSRLARQLCAAHSNNDGVLPLVTLSAKWEQAFQDSLSGEGENRQLAMPPTQLQEFIMQIKQAFEYYTLKGENPVLLTSPLIRPFVRSVIERVRPLTVIMSQNEIHLKARIKTLGQI